MVVTGPWVTDIRHFLDEQGQVPDALPAVPRYMGALVAAVSPLAAGKIFPLDLQCRRRPGHESCPGSIHARIDSETADISWFCPCCGVCRTTASVDLRSGSISGGDLVLRGYCVRCGNDIARVVENVGRA